MANERELEQRTWTVNPKKEKPSQKVYETSQLSDRCKSKQYALSYLYDWQKIQKPNKLAEMKKSSCRADGTADRPLQRITPPN